MTDENKTKAQLLDELVAMRQRVAELEASAAQLEATAEHKRAEEQLRLHSALLDLVSDGIVASGPGGRIVYANRAAHDLRDLAPGELVGRTLAEFDTPEHAVLVQPRLNETARRGDYRFEVALGKGDRRRPVEIHTRTVESEGMQWVIASERDITARRQAEKERRELEAQVQKTQKLESLGVMAGGIAHDFNNILTGLLGSADLALLELPAQSAARPLVEAIRQAARRAADLTKQMLAYSGKGHFVVEDVDLNDLIRDMSGLLTSAVSRKVTLRYELSTDLPAVRADPTQVAQIIANLVTNASEAVGEQPGMVVVRTYVTEWERTDRHAAQLGEPPTANRYVALEVTDTGCGMDEETQARMFEPFFTTKFTGRGLGLAAVQGIVRGHNGAVHVASEPGQGTTCQVLLPACDHRVEPVGARIDENDGWRGAGKILVVDDEAMVRTVARLMLEHLGFSVLTASDGIQAVDLFRERHGEIDCVLLDLTMPRMDGEETFDELCRIRDDVPVILSSGYNEQESIERFGDKGLAGFLQKPYEVLALRDQLRVVLGHAEPNADDSGDTEASG